MDTHDIAQALNNIGTNSTALSEGTRDFLTSPTGAKKFAEKMVEAASRPEFMSIEGCSNEVYNELRNLLNSVTFPDGTKIVAKRGRAGGLAAIKSVAAPIRPDLSVEAEKTVEDEAETVERKELSLEKEFYPIVQQWAKDAGYTNCSITGGRLPGFKWENPDLIALDHSISGLTRSLRFFITSFEVKLRVEPYAVWQAAHYYRFSHEAYRVT